MDKSTHIKIELSIKLNRTGLYYLNGKTITQNFNKVYLKQLNNLIQGFKEKVFEKISDEIMKDMGRIDLIVSRQSRFEKWLEKAKVTTKEIKK
tara:strand:+ start:269 stop:547 length:279 start_codon:yes stop_codon:yes gene_type:complete